MTKITEEQHEDELYTLYEVEKGWYITTKTIGNMTYILQNEDGTCIYNANHETRYSTPVEEEIFEEIEKGNE